MEWRGWTRSSECCRLPGSSGRSVCYGGELLREVCQCKKSSQASLAPMATAGHTVKGGQQIKFGCKIILLLLLLLLTLSMHECKDYSSRPVWPFVSLLVSLLVCLSVSLSVC